MNKSILSLVILGLFLAVLHAPNVVLALAMIMGLVTLAVKLIWSVMQAFSTSGRAQSRYSG
ncbi:MAG: hypothetical protein AAGC93_06845 [Cyanobacteria bacterium P01_F01_bin.53]